MRKKEERERKRERKRKRERERVERKEEQESREREKERGLQLMDGGCHKKLAALNFESFFHFFAGQQELNSIFHFKLFFSCRGWLLFQDDNNNNNVNNSSNYNRNVDINKSHDSQKNNLFQKLFLLVPQSIFDLILVFDGASS